jgi:hypothetical protein
MSWQVIPVTFKNQSLQTGIQARGNDLQLVCFSSACAGREADIQLQAAQFLLSNCLPKPSSIFHSFTGENNTSFKFSKM